MITKDERVDEETRRRFAVAYSDEQTLKRFFDEFMDPWTDWHDPNHWAVLERIATIIERLQHI